MLLRARLLRVKQRIANAHELFLSTHCLGESEGSMEMATKIFVFGLIKLMPGLHDDLRSFCLVARIQICMCGCVLILTRRACWLLHGFVLSALWTQGGCCFGNEGFPIDAAMDWL
jgi:hypothetical protein